MNQFLKEYLAVLRLEKNLSENTVASYRNDLNSLFGFLSDRGVEDPSEIKNEHLTKFFKSLADTGLSSSSAARYLSSVKGFFKYLYLNKYITENPVDKISAPKLSKNLPDVLSVNDVDAILSKPDTEDKLGLRDKSILETLYACGLRVSELINLKLSNIFF